MAKDTPDSEPQISFEAALEQVEQIVESIESGEIGLERSIAEYERGMELLKRCRQMLARAEQKVEEVTGRMQQEAPGADEGGAPAEGRGEEPPF